MRTCEDQRLDAPSMLSSTHYLAAPLWMILDQTLNPVYTKKNNIVMRSFTAGLTSAHHHQQISVQITIHALKSFRFNES